MKTGGFAGFKNQVFSKRFIKEDDPEIFNVTYGYGKKLEKLDLDKDVLEVKALATKIGDLSKLTFKQNFFLYIYIWWKQLDFSHVLHGAWLKNYKYMV